MYRATLLTVLAGALLPALLQAQDVPSPQEALRQNAEQKTQAWETLAKSLETRIRGLLPCDPRIAAAVNEVSRASDARLIAFNDYFAAVLAEASAQAKQASALQDSQRKAGAELLDTEHAEGIEERAGTENQISQLTANVQRRPELRDAETALRAVANLTDQRNLVMVQLAPQVNSLNESLRTLASQAQEAESAIKALAAAHQTEADRWRAYYAARATRVQAECIAVNPGVAPRPRADVRKPGPSGGALAQ